MCLSAKKYLDGWLVHYNFFRPHMSLNDRTPASVAGIRFPFRNWKDITEQPYEKTARIQIKPYPFGETTSVPKKVYKHKARVSRKSPRTSPPMTSISQVRK